jgi:hypothetical protein
LPEISKVPSQSPLEITGDLSQETVDHRKDE